MDSIAGKWNTLKENMKSLVTNNVSSDMFKGLLDGANGVVVAIDKISSSLGKIGSFGAIAGLMTLISSMSKFTAIMQGTTTLSNMGTMVTGVFNAFKNGFTAMSSGTGIMGSLRAGASGLMSGFTGLAGSAGAVAMKQIALNAVWSAIGWGAIIAGITAVSWAYKNVVKATETAVKASKEQQQAIRDKQQSLNTEKQGLISLASEYDRLASKSSLTAKEAKRFSELKKEIASISPDLVSGYDSKNDPILKLNGSMKDYIASLDRALEAQNRLFNAEKSKETEAYLKENDKNKSSNDGLLGDSNYSKYTKEKLAVGMNAIKTLDDFENWTNKNTLEKMMSAREKYNKKIEDNNKRVIENASKEQEERWKKDEAIQSTYMNKFQDSYATAGMSQASKNIFSGFMQKLDWGNLSTDQADGLYDSLVKLGNMSIESSDKMGTSAKKTKEALKAYEDNGKIKAYGKALQEIALESKKFDVESWGRYMDEVNKGYENGALTLDQYNDRMGVLAETIAKLTGGDKKSILESLIGSGDVTKALESASSGLNKFLGNYKKSLNDIEKGDNLALTLQKQYESLQSFFEEVKIKGKITPEMTMEWSKNEDLPKQLRTMLKATGIDGEVTEVEQKLLMKLSSEIENEGQLKQETVDKLQGLFDGTLKIPDTGIEIEGIQLTKEQAESLRESLQALGDVNIGDAGLGDAQEKAKGYKEAISSIEKEVDSLDGKKIALAIEKQPLINTKEEVESLYEAVKLVPEDKRLDFIANCGEVFDGVTSVDEGIKKIPDNKKVFFNIGVEGDERLSSIQAKFEAMPKEVQTIIMAKDYGTDKIDYISTLLSKLDAKTVTAILDADTEDALGKCTSLEEFLETIEGLIVSAGIEVETEGVEEAEEAVDGLEEADGTESTATLTFKTEGEQEDAYNKVKELMGLDGEEANVSVVVKKEGDEPQKTKEELDGVNGKTSTATVETKKEGEEPEKTKEELDGVNGKKVTATVETKKEGDEPKKTKEELDEVDGKTSSSNIKINTPDENKLKVHEEQMDKANRTVDSTVNANVNGSEKIDEADSKRQKMKEVVDSNVNMKLNGLEKVNEAKTSVDSLKDKDVSIGVKLKDSISNIFDRLFPKTETKNVEVSIKAKDEATPVLEKITSFKNKEITINIKTSGDEAIQSIEKLSKTKIPDVKFNIKANGDEAIKSIDRLTSTKIDDVKFKITADGGDVAKSQVEKIANTKVSDKKFSITCDGGSQVANDVKNIANIKVGNKSFTVSSNATAVNGQISALSSRTIAPKKFSITCSDNATSKVTSISVRKIQNKKFSITCSDNASSKVTSVQSKKINNKSFTISCTDNASGTLNSIKSKISGISGKTVTITAKYAVSGKKPTGIVGSLSKPQIETLTSVQNVETINTVSTTSIDNSASTLTKGASTLNDSLAGVMANTRVDANLTMRAIDTNVDLLTNMTNALKKLGAELDAVNQKQEYAFGNSKALLLKHEISLLQQQQELLRLNQYNMSEMSNKLRSYLSDKGFSFNNDGSIDNYNSKLIALEENVKRLKKAEEDYTGDNEATKKSLSSAYNNANDELTKIKSSLGDYYDMVSSEMPSSVAEWEKLANEIRKAKNEIYEANKEQANFINTARTTELEYQYKKLANTMDLLDKKLELSTDEEKIKLYQEQLSLLEQQQSKQQELYNSLKGEQAFYKNYLGSKGFNFDDSGEVTNWSSRLGQLVDDDEIESIKKAYEDYMKLQSDSIPNAQKEWYDLKISQNDVKESIDNIIKSQKEMKKMMTQSGIDQLISQQEALSNSLDLLKTKMETAYGKNQTIYLQQQITLIEQQKKKQEELINLYSKQASGLRDELKSIGLSFDEFGQITNYEEIMNTQKTIEDMKELKSKVEEYLDVQNDGLANSQKEWYELNGKIKDAQDAILNAKEAMEKFKDDTWIQKFETDINILESLLDKNDTMMELSGSNQNKLLEERIDLYKKLEIETKKLLDYQNNKRDELKNKIIEYGFVINDDGTIEDTAYMLEKLKDCVSEDEFDYVSGTIEEYLESISETIPDLENKLLEYQKEFESIQKKKLETTQKIEKEITNIYNDQIEKRKKKIEEERDAQIESLNKAKDAYNKWRKEVDYKNDYEEQLKTVEDLEKKIESAKKDDSLSGKKKLNELLKQLNDEQKKLEDLVSDKIDSDMNDMFDDQITAVGDKADEEIKSIEDLWSDSKIAEMIKNALETGLFTDIDGNISKLDEALMDFANNSEDYLGVMGDSLKSELLDNLGIALETMKQLDEITNSLKIPDFSKYIVDSDILKGLDDVSNGGSVNNNNTLTFGDTIITIEGNATQETIDDISSILKEHEDNIIKQIMNNVK